MYSNSFLKLLSLFACSSFWTLACAFDTSSGNECLKMAKSNIYLNVISSLSCTVLWGCRWGCRSRPCSRCALASGRWGRRTRASQGPTWLWKLYVFRLLQGLMDSTKVFCIKYTLHHSNKVFLQHRLMILLLNFTFLLFHVQNILNILSN